MRKFRKIQTRETHNYGHWYRVDIDEVVLPSGESGLYNVVRMPRFVIIIPVDRKGNLYLVKQYRYTIDQFTTELPMGHSDGEEELIAAKRELLEETGLVSDDWTELGTIYEANGIGDIPGIIFLARNVMKSEEPLDMDDEALDGVVTMSINQLRRLIGKGEIRDSATISSFALADYSGILD